MQATVPQSSNVFLRDDTFFGVCEALGEDFGLAGRNGDTYFFAKKYMSPSCPGPP